MSGYTLGVHASEQPGTATSEEQAFQPFWDTYHTVTDRYAGGEVDRQALIQGAIKGMIDALGDPYSSYLTSQEYRDSLQGLSGQFEGIGAEIATQAADGTQGCATLGADCRLLIIAAIAGSPAEKAGLKAGDLILAADGTSLDGLTVDEARDRIRGPKGSVVTLTVQRGSDDPFDLAITRDVVHEREVVSEELAGGTVGYVRLSGFSDDAAVELHDALAAQVKDGRTKLILDLRGNPGGYVTAARSVASQFIGSGVIFWEQDAKGAQVSTEALPDGVATDPDLRIVVSHRRRQRVGQRDRGRRPPGHEAGDAGRPDVVRQGDRPAVAGAHRRGRGIQAHDRPLADAGQALDPQGRPDPGRGGDVPEPVPAGEGSDARQGARGARRGGGSARPPARGPPDWVAGLCAPLHCRRIGYGLGTKGGDVQ